MRDQVKKTVARPAAKGLKQPGPGAYEPSWDQIEDRRPAWKLSAGVPKRGAER